MWMLGQALGSGYLPALETLQFLPMVTDSVFNPLFEGLMRETSPRHLRQLILPDCTKSWHDADYNLLADCLEAREALGK